MISYKNLENLNDHINHLENIRYEDDNLRKRWIRNGGQPDEIKSVEIQNVFEEEIDRLKGKREILNDKQIKYDLEYNEIEQKLNLLKDCLSELRKK